MILKYTLLTDQNNGVRLTAFMDVGRTYFSFGCYFPYLPKKINELPFLFVCFLLFCFGFGLNLKCLPWNHNLKSLSILGNVCMGWNLGHTKLSGLDLCFLFPDQTWCNKPLLKTPDFMNFDDSAMWSNAMLLMMSGKSQNPWIKINFALFWYLDDNDM